MWRTNRAGDRFEFVGNDGETVALAVTREVYLAHPGDAQRFITDRGFPPISWQLVHPPEPTWEAPRLSPAKVLAILHPAS